MESILGGGRYGGEEGGASGVVPLYNNRWKVYFFLKYTETYLALLSPDQTNMLSAAVYMTTTS